MAKETVTPQDGAEPPAHPSAVAESAADSAAESAASARAVKRGIRLIALFILVSMGWYLLADRFTPYTSQARIQGFVVGVAPKVSGLVTDVFVDNNAEVRAGDSLFQIDQSDYIIALERARAEYDNAQKQVSAGDSGVDAARAKLLSAEANARKAAQDYERLQRLYEKDPGAISVRRLEISEASLASAQAGVVAAQADIERAIESKGGADDDSNTFIRTASVAVARAELDLANTLVKAPQAGVITDLRTDVGLFAGAGKPVMTLVATRLLWVVADYTENNLGHLRPGIDVEVTFDVLPGEVFRGKIQGIGLGVNAANPPPAGQLPSVSNSRDWLRQSQRFPVEIAFETNDLLEQRLRIGGQAAVIAYADTGGPLNWLGMLYIRLMSWLSYAY